MLKNKVLFFLVVSYVFSNFVSLGFVYAAGEKNTIIERQQFNYDARGKRNPFIPLITSEGKILKLDTQDNGSLILEGIIYDKNGISYAIVNGSVVKIGDTINDTQILKIEKDRVVFIKDGQISEVILKKGDE